MTETNFYLLNILQKYELVIYENKKRMEFLEIHT